MPNKKSPLCAINTWTNVKAAERLSLLLHTQTHTLRELSWLSISSAARLLKDTPWKVEMGYEKRDPAKDETHSVSNTSTGITVCLGYLKSPALHEKKKKNTHTQIHPTSYHSAVFDTFHVMCPSLQTLADLILIYATMPCRTSCSCDVDAAWSPWQTSAWLILYMG